MLRRWQAPKFGRPKRSQLWWKELGVWWDILRLLGKKKKTQNSIKKSWDHIKLQARTHARSGYSDPKSGGAIFREVAWYAWEWWIKSSKILKGERAESGGYMTEIKSNFKVNVQKADTYPIQYTLRKDVLIILLADASCHWAHDTTKRPCNH